MIALLAGRGVHGRLSVLPMVVAAAYGAGVARRGQPATGRRFLRYLRRAGVALSAALAVLIAAVLAVPARTAPIRGADGTSLPGSVAELRAPSKQLATVDAGGHRAIFEQPGQFVTVLTRVLAETR